MTDMDWLVSEAERRKRDTNLNRWMTTANELVGVWNGHIPQRYLKYFTNYEIPHQINQFRTAHEDLTHLATKVFALNVRPRNNSAKAKDEAAKIENICYSFNEAAFNKGGMEHGLLKLIEAHWLLLTGECVRLILPDYENKSAYFYFKNPLTHYPPPGWAPWSPVPLDGSMFLEKESLSVLKARYPDAARQLANKYENNNGFGTETDPNQPIDIALYYSKDAWIAGTTSGIQLMRSDDGLDKNHPGVCGVVSTSTYDGIGPKGRPALADLPDIQVANTRVLSQTLETVDKNLSPYYFSDPIEGGGSPKRGKWNIFDTQATQGRAPRAEKMAPDSPQNAMQLIAFMTSYGRVISRNPEAFQGEGEADSRAALVELKGGVEGWVKDGVWPLIKNAEPRSYATAMQMMRNIWGNERITTQGSYVETYTPNVALAGYEHSVRVKVGQGMGGHIGEVQRMQKFGAGLMTLDDLLENDPGVMEPRAYKRQLHIDKLIEALYQQTLAQAQNGQLVPDAIPKIIEKMESEDKEWYVAWKELHEAGELTQPPPEQMGAPPGLSPDIMAALGGGQDPYSQGSLSLPPAPGQLRALPEAV